MPLARRLVNGRERGCLQVVPCIVLRLVNMSTRAMRLKTQARVLACLQVVYPNLSVVKEQSLSASLVRLEKELFPLYLGHRFATRLRLGDTHGHCPASPLLRPHPTTAFAFASCSSPKFLCRTFGKCRPLCPARALAVGFAVASGDLPSGLRPSAHASSHT